LLIEAGGDYFDYGVDWISYILKNNNLIQKEIKENTLNYIENYIRLYIYKNREKIKHDNELKQKVIVILNFLIEKGSVIGFLLRERIL
jgi:hypothetical protein